MVKKTCAKWSKVKVCIAFLGAILVSVPKARADKDKYDELGLSPNSRKCLEQVYKKGILRKYDLKHQVPFSTRTSSREGIGATSASSAQSSTAAFDPGVSTGQLQSYTQFFSQKGVCAKYLSQHQPWLERQKYVVDHFDQLQENIAVGGGEYLEAFQFLSGCSQDSRSTLFQVLKNNHLGLFEGGSPTDFSIRADHLIRSHQELGKACPDLTA
jgi:hypothetical protein